MSVGRVRVYIRPLILYISAQVYSGVSLQHRHSTQVYNCCSKVLAKTTVTTNTVCSFLFTRVKKYTHKPQALYTQFAGYKSLIGTTYTYVITYINNYITAQSLQPAICCSHLGDNTLSMSSLKRLQLLQSGTGQYKVRTGSNMALMTLNAMYVHLTCSRLSLYFCCNSANLRTSVIGTNTCVL